MCSSHKGKQLDVHQLGQWKNNGTPLNNKKKVTIDIHHNMNESQNDYAQCKKSELPSKKKETTQFHLNKSVENLNSSSDR